MGGCCSTPNSDDEGGFYNQGSSHRQEQVIANRPRSNQLIAHHDNAYLVPPRIPPSPLFQTVTTTTTTGTTVFGSTSLRNASSRQQQLFSVPVVNNVPTAARKNAGRRKIAHGAARNLSGLCEACGGSDHIKADCRYRERLCFYCREKGHIISICPAKRRDQKFKQTRRGRQ
ncbi:uncharacterized protein LOC129725544 [Wyeomyia smithii]|uniref:uncharacterized protein LOC129725544 n=1 Tax=Wyeomyia smithii TaxID=174621 RepID=UPI00246806C6|nr:uncharacterized protein LOC129725544 [Wyeomyia smithii]